MDWTSVATRFREWAAQTKERLTAVDSAPNVDEAPEWYAGLTVSPASFSRQLGDLQISLQRANNARDAEPELQAVNRGAERPQNGRLTTPPGAGD